MAACVQQQQAKQDRDENRSSYPQPVGKEEEHAPQTPWSGSWFREVDAPDVAAAKPAAVARFELDEIQRDRIIV